MFSAVKGNMIDGFIAKGNIYSHSDSSTFIIVYKVDEDYTFYKGNGIVGKIDTEDFRETFTKVQYSNIDREVINSLQLLMN